jgi:hypothetical protein
MFDTIAKLRRVYRPKDRRFWLMIILNVLSGIFLSVLQSKDVNGPARLVLSVVVLVNAGIGMWLMWQLLSEPLDRVKSESGVSNND